MGDSKKRDRGERDFLYCIFCNPVGGPVRGDAVASFFPGDLKLPLLGAMFDHVRWDREKHGIFPDFVTWENMRCPHGAHRVMFEEGVLRVRGGLFRVGVGYENDVESKTLIEGMSEQEKRDHMREAVMDMEFRRASAKASLARRKDEYVTRRGVK